MWVCIVCAVFFAAEVPHFEEEMKDMWVPRQETAVLKCRVEGNPKPTVTWLKDGEPLGDSQRHFYTAADQFPIIVESNADDVGEYTCVAKNTLGEVSGVSYLVVEEGSGGVLGSGDGSRSHMDKSTTTTGIIIIAVVCCMVGTSLVWVGIIVYQTRRKRNHGHEQQNHTPQPMPYQSKFSHCT